MKSYFVRNRSIFALTLTAFVLSLLFLGTKSIVFDEAFGVAITGTWQRMVHMLVTQEGNMWFYYILLFIWTRIGQSVFWIRVLSAIFAALSVPFVYLIGKKLFDKKTGLIAASLLMCNVFFIHYAQLARGYSLLLFLTTLGSYLLLKYQEKKSRKLMGFYVIVMSLAVYVHLYALLVIAGHIVTQVLDIVKGRESKSLKVGVLKKYLCGVGIIGICSLPLFLAPSFHSSQIGWLTKPHLSSLVGLFVILSGDFLPLAVMSGLLIAKLLYEKKYQSKETAKLLIWLIVPVVISFLYSQIFTPMYQSVYFISLVPWFMLLIASTIAKISNRRIFKITIAIVLLCSSIRLYGWYREDTHFQWVIENQHEDWKAVSSFVSSHATKRDGIIFYGYSGIIPYEYYRPTMNVAPTELLLTTQPYELGGGGKYPDPDPFVLKYATHYLSRMWVVLFNDEPDILGRKYQKGLIMNSLRQQYSNPQQFNFSKIHLLLYR